MSNIAVRKRRLTTTQLSAIALNIGEICVNTTTKALVAGDGVTVGGIPMALGSHTHSAGTESVAGFILTADKTILDALALNAIQDIDSNGTLLPTRSVLNFSTSFLVTDNPGSGRTDVDMIHQFLTPSGASFGVASKLVVGQSTISQPSPLATTATSVFTLTGNAVFTSSSTYWVMLNCTVAGVHVNATNINASTFTVSCYSLNGSNLPAMPINFFAFGT